jgi:hypothetical protein
LPSPFDHHPLKHLFLLAQAKNASLRNPVNTQF